MKYDFHSHSLVSDGNLSPIELVERAFKNKVEYYAITDHDDFSGFNSAKVVADKLGVKLISGVEISTTWCGKTIHILGYGFNVEDKKFAENLEKMRYSRIERAYRINDVLTSLGFPDTLVGAQKVAKREHPISRTHFARYMIQMGYCRNFAESMNKYLADGKPAAVPHTWAEIPTAISWIHNAGGVAFLAHPLRYKLPEGLDLEDLIAEFIKSGGDGLEVVYASHSPRQIDYLSDLALKNNLAISGGSDFHTDEATMGGVDIGSISQLPKKNTSIFRILGLD